MKGDQKYFNTMKQFFEISGNQPMAKHYGNYNLFFKDKVVAMFAGRLEQINNFDPSSIGKNYYATDDMTDKAIGPLENHGGTTPEMPFFLYMAYTAPHCLLQAKEQDIAKYKGRFDRGLDALRQEKFARMKEMGIIDLKWELPAMTDSGADAWEKENSKSWRIRAMEVYAAMVDCMDQNIGRHNTFLIFLSDNGGNAEFLNIRDTTKLPGGPGYSETNGHYGAGWAGLACPIFPSACINIIFTRAASGLLLLSTGLPA
jgi:arylsulfatase A-like enzyme